MNTALWIIQGILAAMFAFAGITKATQSKEKLEKQFPWARDLSLNTVRFIGISELLGAVGLILPWLTDIAPILTPISALGLGLIMILALSTVHLKNKEYKAVGMNALFLILAVFVAYGRF
jgi:uncharacterized membrane protein YphA (DoxX/SURF4 family)